MKKCTQCGAVLPDSAKFCGKCGATLAGSPEIPLNREGESKKVLNEQDRLGEELLKPKPELPRPAQDKQSKPWLWVVAGVLALGLLGVMAKTCGGGKEAAPPVTDEAADTTELVEETKDVAPAIFETKRITLFQDRDVTTCDLKVDFPIKGTPELLRSVRTFINSTLHESLGGDCYGGDLSDGERMLKYYFDREASNPDNELDVEFEVYYENSKFVTMFYSIDAHELAAAHGNDTFGGASFLKSDGSMADWGMFINDSHMQAMICKGLREYYGDDRFDEKYVSFPDTPPILTSDCVKFVYQRYELGTSYAEGAPFFCIPYTAIKEQMKPSVRALIE